MEPNDDCGATAEPIVVTAEGNAARTTARALARRLGLNFSEFPPDNVQLRLTQTDTHVELCDAASGARLRVEFNAADLRRYRAGGGGRNPLRRAIGPGARRVVDATAGLGRDAVHFAALGYRVIAIERNPVISALACDALTRARAEGVLAADNPRWIIGDARVALPVLDPAPETVYLDPMFPPRRKKSAAVRKEMRFLQRLVDDDDASELLTLARACALDRVVVKRPIDAAPLAEGAITAYRGNLVRYDVYRPSEAAR